MNTFENIAPEKCAVLMIEKPGRGDLYFQRKTGGDLLCSKNNYLPRIEQFGDYNFYIGIKKKGK